MNRRIGVVATLAVSALAFTGGAMLYSGTAEGEPTKKVVAGPVDSLVRPHSPIIGLKNAPVTIVEFFDPSCEACRAFYPTVKGIVAKYPKDVRLVMRYLPLHPGSAEAIVILEAARVQGKLEPVTAALLEAQPDWHDGKMDAAWSAAEKAGLDVAKARAMPTTDAMAWMEQDIADARAVGVRGTPTFFVNGEMLVQPSPEQVEARVQAAVAAKGK
ncbi:DsbA family protein [Sphingopyxis sp.]|jgi:protein-disulfide isomerase|uniref:DsbA family protein n=1 Tax=Sphingopyxis sp. TaxID=1908224 RepID=UPI002DFF19A2|nr:thioredoxin domain-containing protein [Sphingopyxis sp.]